MKTLHDFEQLCPSFKDAVVGKQGTEYIAAVDEFMTTNQFEQHINSHIFEDDNFGIWFFTDHVKNECGIMFIEEFGKGGGLLACTREKMYKTIDEYKMSK